MAVCRCHSSSCVLVYGKPITPNLRIVTSMQVTAIRTMSSHPEASATRSRNLWSAFAVLISTAVLLYVPVVAPDRVVGAELRVGREHALELRVLGRLLRDHLVPGLLDRGHDLRRPLLDLHAVLVAHLGHRLELGGLALGDHVAREIAARRLDHRLVLV